MSIFWSILVVTVIAAVCGVGLSVASSFFAVAKNEKTEKIRQCLPGANCGACGYAGCDGYAEALSEGSITDASLCAPGGADALKAISEILGVDVGDFVKKTAFLKCNGNCNNTEQKADYLGIKNCKAANMAYNGTSLCDYGCMGFGDCAAACKYDAISIVDGIAKINSEKCTGCGACVNACPKTLILLLPSDTKYIVKCSNKDKGAVTRKVCKVGCIGCMKCQKVCESGAVTVAENLAHIDPDKCTGCGKCAEECPQNCIN